MQKVFLYRYAKRFPLYLKTISIIFKQEPPLAGTTLDIFIIKYGFDLEGQGHIKINTIHGEIKMVVLL